MPKLPQFRPSVGLVLGRPSVVLGRPMLSYRVREVGADLIRLCDCFNVERELICEFKIILFVRT